MQTWNSGRGQKLGASIYAFGVGGAAITRKELFSNYKEPEIRIPPSIQSFSQARQFRTSYWACRVWICRESRAGVIGNLLEWMQMWALLQCRVWRVCSGVLIFLAPVNRSFYRPDMEIIYRIPLCSTDTVTGIEINIFEWIERWEIMMSRRHALHLGTKKPK